MTKKIFKIASIVLLATTLTLAIITLINYYSYVNVLNKLTQPDVDLITKFDLQEDRDTYLYRTLGTIIWTCYIAIATTITTITSMILNKQKRAVSHCILKLV